MKAGQARVEKVDHGRSQTDRSRRNQRYQQLEPKPIATKSQIGAATILATHSAYFKRVWPSSTSYPFIKQNLYDLLSLLNT